MTRQQQQRLRSGFQRQQDDMLFALMVAFFGVVGLVSLIAATLDLWWSIH